MIYLDHNATTPIIPEVLEAMMPNLTTEWGNRRAERRSAWASAAGPYRTVPPCATGSNNAAIATAREQVAELLGGSLSRGGSKVEV